MNALVRYWEGLKQVARVFVPGPGVVSAADMVFGMDGSEYQPAEYGAYLATSTGVYVCARKRATLLSSLPLKLHRIKRNGDKDEITRGELFALLQKVNPFWTFNRLIEMTELSLCLWGEAFWFLDRGGNGKGTPREIWWARADQVRVVPHPTKYISHFIYQPTNGGEEIVFDPSETIWLRFPNPLNEFEGLSPLAAARLAADTASAAMKSNRNIFANGVQMAGFLGPKPGTVLSETQAKDLEQGISRRFKGVDKAHRIAVMRYETQFQQTSFTPKDAEFLGALKWSLEDICRAYGVPLDLVGGERTYANAKEARFAIWSETVLPEARFIATELTEQLLPLFPGQADLVEFDSSDVEVLKEAENERWTRIEGMIKIGRKTINEVRADEGEDPVPWGDAWWAPINLVPVSTAEIIEPDPPALPAPAESSDDPDDPPRRLARAITYGSDEHKRRWRQLTRRTTPHERKVAETTATLMRRQRTAVLARLKQGERNAAQALEDPFDLPRWIKAFRQGIRPVLTELVEDAGQHALDDIGLAMSFDVQEPRVVRFLEQRAQRFARQVNETTWRSLKESLAAGVDEGETIDQLAARVEAVMGDRIRSSAETIARTETLGAFNGGTLESWRQSGVVARKRWLAALDERTRDTHVAAHEQEVALDADFHVGSGSGPSPGQIGIAAEDIQCRCTMTAVLDVDVEAESE